MCRSYRRITYAVRCQIWAQLQSGISISEISVQLGFHKSSISREVRRNRSGKIGFYKPAQAQAMSQQRRAHCARPRVIQGVLEGIVVWGLFEGWSPEQIVGRLRVEKVGYSVSHQSIYNFIKEQDPGLRSLLRRRSPRGCGRYSQRRRAAKIGRLRISQRPQIINARKRFGDWERDGMYGANRNQLILCVERKSRITKIGKIGTGSRELVQSQTLELIKESGLPFTSLTNDRGPELDFVSKIPVPVFYCDPQRPDQKGTSENQINLLRQYIKRDTDLTSLSKEELRALEARLNNRPRKCLGFKTPYEIAYKENVALIV